MNKISGKLTFLLTSPRVLITKLVACILKTGHIWPHVKADSIENSSYAHYRRLINYGFSLFYGDQAVALNLALIEESVKKAWI